MLLMMVLRMEDMKRGREAGESDLDAPNRKNYLVLL
jgi:hypothetical protein